MENNTPAVEAFLAELEHPLKAELEAVRRIIKQANPKVDERIFFKVPSFFYKEDILNFHPRSKDCVHLVMVFPKGLAAYKDSALFLGAHQDRRELKFKDMADIQAKKAELEAVINDWVRVMDEA